MERAIPAGEDAGERTNMNGEHTMTTDPSDVLTVEVADGIALVTVNRPEVRNAINATVLQVLTRTLEELAADKAGLEAEVEQLRGFETDYRSRLTAYIEGQLREIRSQERVEPAQRPA